MKPIELTQAEIDLLKEILAKRRSAYTDSTDEFVTANRSHHKKWIQKLDHINDSLSVRENYLNSNAKGFIQGCMSEFLMDEALEELRALFELTQPAQYKYCLEHPVKAARLNLVIGLWNKLVKKEERYQRPAVFLGIMDDLLEAEKVYASFSGLKPYQVAFVTRSGKVYRLALDWERDEIQGPFLYSEEELADIFMKELSPKSFCKALQSYGLKGRMHGWHTLLLEKLGGEFAEV